MGKYPGRDMMKRPSYRPELENPCPQLSSVVRLFHGHRRRDIEMTASGVVSLKVMRGTFLRIPLVAVRGRDSSSQQVGS